MEAIVATVYFVCVYIFSVVNICIFYCKISFFPNFVFLNLLVPRLNKIKSTRCRSHEERFHMISFNIGMWFDSSSIHINHGALRRLVLTRQMFAMEFPLASSVRCEWLECQNFAQSNAKDPSPIGIHCFVQVWA